MQTSVGIFASCGDGWREIVEDAIARLAKLGVEPSDYCQIKEKHGTLRIYLLTYRRHASGPDKVADVIECAEEESAVTCSDCGAPGTLRMDLVWRKVLCNECYRRDLHT